MALRTCCGFLSPLPKDVGSKLSFLCPLKFYYSADHWSQVQAGRCQHQVICSLGLQAAPRRTPSPPLPVATGCPQGRQEQLLRLQLSGTAASTGRTGLPSAQRPVQLLYQSVLPAAALCCHCAFLSHTPSFTSVMGRGASVVHTGMLSSDTAHRIRGEMEHGTFDGHTQAYTATQSTDHLLCHGLG